MFRATILAVLVLGLAACGSAATSTAIQIEFGLSGGNIVPMDAVISPQGTVDWQRPFRLPPRRLSSATVASLSRLVRTGLPGLSSRQCPGTLPDIASQFIRAGGRTVRVHGGCEPRFTRLWNQLARAVGLKR